jgi:4-amino-4-deoxy-L-arabinose transferase-like glycosyltransferase
MTIRLSASPASASSVPSAGATVSKPEPLSSRLPAFPWVIFWAALIVRIAYMTLAHTWHMRTVWDHFQFGYEMGRIARALDTGYGYADPFWGHTGPTAWVPPAYPLLLAGVFKICGIYSPLSAWTILAINCVFSAFTIPAIWEIAARCFNRKVALWSSWIWALYPAAMQYAVKWVWEMTLTTFLFTWVLALTLRMRTGRPGRTSRPGTRGSAALGVGSGEGDSAGADGPEISGFATDPSVVSDQYSATPKRWAIFGLLWGLIALSNPSLCIFLPVCGLWILWGSPTWKRQIGSAAVAALLFVLCLAPWTYRNWLAFHKFVPIRANLGVELYLGNGPGATGLLMEYDHPFEAPDQLRLYKKMGEIDYAKMRGAMAKRIIRQDPGRFLKLSLKRVYYYWFSVPHPGNDHWYVEYGRNFNYQFTSLAGLLGLALALRRRAPARWLFFWAFALLPLTYYAVTVHARFRHSLEPLIAILGVYLFQAAERTRRPGKRA